MTSKEAFDAWLAAIENERLAVEAMLAADDAEPYSQQALEDANTALSEAIGAVRMARFTWYEVRGKERPHVQAVAA